MNSNNFENLVFIIYDIGAGNFSKSAESVWPCFRSAREASHGESIRPWADYQTSQRREEL